MSLGAGLSQEHSRVEGNYFASPTLPKKMKERLLTDVQGTLNIINQVEFIFLLKQLLKTAVILLLAAF